MEEKEVCKSKLKRRSRGSGVVAVETHDRAAVAAEGRRCIEKWIDAKISRRHGDSASQYKRHSIRLHGSVLLPSCHRMDH